MILKRYSGLSMNLYGSLWYKLMSTEFIVGDGKLR